MKTGKRETRKRSIIHPVRLDSQEKLALQKMANHYHISVAQLLRDTALKRKIMTGDEKRLRADLGRLGGLFKLGLTQDHLTFYHLEFKQILNLIRQTVQRIDQQATQKANH